MVAKPYNSRPNRPSFYQLKWNDDSIFTQSRIAAIIIRDSWIKSARMNKQTGTVEMICVFTPQLKRLLHITDVVSVLNGTWDASTVSKHVFSEGELIKETINRSTKILLTRCNKLRAGQVYFNSEMRKFLEHVCMDVNLVTLLFQSPSANVFVAAVKLLIPETHEYKAQIQKHARDIYYVLRKPERRPKSRPKSM